MSSPERALTSDQKTATLPSPAANAATSTRPAPPRLDRMPQWKVLLHNDDLNLMVYVVETIVGLGLANRHVAVLRSLEAHQRGVALLATTHRERAELIQEQLKSKRLTATIEPE